MSSGPERVRWGLSGSDVGGARVSSRPGWEDEVGGSGAGVVGTGVGEMGIGESGAGGMTVSSGPGWARWA